MRAKNLAVMFTDIESFTAKTSKKSRIQIELLLNAHQQITESAVRDFSGLIVKNLGDGYLIIFDSPTNAVLCATTLLNEIKKHNRETPKHAKFKLRIGIASGDVIMRAGDVFGEPVNLAARILGIAEVGTVYLSQSVLLSMNKNEIPVIDLGEVELKGMPEPTRVYKVGKSGFSFKPYVKGAMEIISGGSMSRPFRYALIVSYIALTIGLIKLRSDIVGEIIPTGGDVQGAKSTNTTPEKPYIEFVLPPTVEPTPASTPNSSLDDIIKNSKGKFKGLLKKLLQ